MSESECTLKNANTTDRDNTEERKKGQGFKLLNGLS